MNVNFKFDGIMKKLIFILLISLASVNFYAQITKIEPAFWWTDMKNTELQLMVYGKNIADLEADISYPGVTLSKTVKAESPNYLFLYLNINNAKPGKFDILFSAGKKKTKIPYELKERKVGSSDRQGFNSSDVLYLIMPDRFSKGETAKSTVKLKFPVDENRNDPNARHGGNLIGIENHLDYIADLGVTAIWLNPVLENDMPHGSYHGYATTDYYKVDPRFGTNEDYARLIDRSHQKGMKVVMDMIFNHCGSEHVWMYDRPFKDWFNHPDGFYQTSFRTNPHFDPYASDFDTDRAIKGWFVEAMPDLNQLNTHLMTYLIQNSIWWIEYAGIDGIRMDTHPYADFEPMSQWCKAVTNEYPKFNIVGEAWYNVIGGTAFWQADSRLNPKGNSNLKTVMDFPLLGEMGNAFTEETEGFSGLNRLYELLSVDYLYANPANVLTFLDNHDTNRFLSGKETDLNKYKQALTFLLTTRGIPQIYYGTEILMSGSKEGSDGYVRKDFPGGWPGDAVNMFDASGRSQDQNEAWNFMQNLLKWRKGNDVIAKGSLKHFLPEGTGIYVYSREYNGETVMVIINGSDKERTLSVNRYAEIIGKVQTGKDVLSGKSISLSNDLILSPRQCYILELGKNRM